MSRRIEASPSSRLWASGRLRIFALIQFLITASGVPLPVSAAGSSDSQPYPCRDHACGCRSAERCWRSCCCLSNREKLVWAKRNKVVAPDYVVEAAARESSAQSSCGTRKCCSMSKPRPSGTKLAKQSTNKKCDEKSSAVSAGNSGVEWVTFAETQRCRGETGGFLAMTTMFPPPLPCDGLSKLEPSGRAATSPRLALTVPSYLPSVPPPRFA